MVIVEYCKYGNLSNFLRAKREFFLPYRVIKNSTETVEVSNCMISYLKSNVFALDSAIIKLSLVSFLVVFLV